MVFKKLAETNQYRLPATGERIKVDGLVAAAKHNGKHGRILNYDKEKGRYGIQLVLEDGGDDDKRQLLSIKPGNITTLDDTNHSKWDDRLTHVFVPCHIDGLRRLNQFRECARSLVCQNGRCRIFVSISGGGEDDNLCDRAMDILRVGSTLPKPVGTNMQWFVLKGPKKSQFQHFRALMPLSWVVNPSAWLMFLDNDDMYHPFRVECFQKRVREEKADADVDGVFCGGKLLIDDLQFRSKFGDEAVIELNSILNRDDSLDGIMDVAASRDENADKDVLEYFDFCIRTKVLKRFLSITPDEILAHRFCDVRFADFVQKLTIRLADHPYQEWLTMHYRIRQQDRHNFFLKRDLQSCSNALMHIMVCAEDEALSTQTGLDPALIAYCRKDVEEGAIIMVERDDAGLEHRRQMLIPGMDEQFGHQIGTLLWEATCKKFSSFFSAELATKNRLWADASGRQVYDLELDTQHDRHF
ncbi:MAG: hypothetical protein SGILL_009969 [Bacillariaceae sp.]